MSSHDEIDSGETIHTFEVTDEDKTLYKRLDQFLVEKLNDKSRSYIKGLFDKGLISWDDTSPIKDTKIELKR